MREYLTIYVPIGIAILCIAAIVFKKRIAAFINKHLWITLTEDQRKTIDTIIENGVKYALSIPKTKTKEERKKIAMAYILNTVQLTGIDKQYLTIAQELAEAMLDAKLKD